LDYVIRIWNVSTCSHVSSFGTDKDEVRRMCFSPDGSRLVYLSESMMKLWDIATGDCLASMQVKYGPMFPDISFSINGNSIHLGYSHSNIQGWKLSSAHNPRCIDDSPTSLPLPWFLSLYQTKNHTHCRMHIHMSIVAMSGDHGSWTSMADGGFGYHLICFHGKRSSLDLIAEPS
jgi:WD40 repeat protein